MWRIFSLRMKTAKMAAKIGDRYLNVTAEPTFRYFKDIKNNNKYIIYKAMNEIPDGTKEIESYNFVQEITEDNKQR